MKIKSELEESKLILSNDEFNLKEYYTSLKFEENVQNLIIIMRMKLLRLKTLFLLE